MKKPQVRKSKSIRKTLVKGDRIELNDGKIGTIMFKGQTTFAKGEWYGIELDTPEGKHDGLVKKDMRRYFKCKKKHGVFVQRHKIVALAPRKPKSPRASASAPSSGRSSPTSGRASAVHGRVSARGSKRKSKGYEEKKSDVPELGRMKSHKITDEDGNLLRRKMVKSDRVELSTGKTGTVMYIGLTQFATGTWYGLELDDKSGKHDGYVGIKRYYKCKPGYGTFVKREKIVKCLRKEKAKARNVTSATKLEENCIVGVLMDDKEICVGKIRWEGNPRNVFGSHHYGVELRDGGGDNDGTINGKRYFKTPPNCCIFVPRSKIEWLFVDREWEQKGKYPELPL